MPEAGQGLEALWDRFLVRYVVKGIQNQAVFFEMLTQSLQLYGDTIPSHLKITSLQYETWQTQIPTIGVPKNVLQCISSIREQLQILQTENSETDYYISDRRWRKIVHLLRTSALLNGQSAVNLQDCFLIQHCIWNQTKTQANMSELVAKAIHQQANSFQIQLENFQDEIEAFKASIKITLTTTINNQVLEPCITNHEGNSYYQIENIPHPNIAVADYQGLQGSTQTRVTKLWDSKFELYGHYSVGGSSANHALIVNGQAQKLKLTARTVSRKVMQSPNEELKISWREKIGGLVQHKNELLVLLEKSATSNDAASQNPHLFVHQNLQQLQFAEQQCIEQQLNLLELDLKELKMRYSL